jgi:hypothetical protein
MGRVYIYANSDVMKSMQLFTERASSQIENGLSDRTLGFHKEKMHANDSLYHGITGFLPQKQKAILV